jgi:anti-anti-sigma factor
MTGLPERGPFHFEVEETRDANGHRTAGFRCHGKMSLGHELTSFYEKGKSLIAEGVDIVLDMGDVTDISDGIGYVVMLKSQSMRKANVRLVLENVPPRVDGVFRITGLDRIFGGQTPRE